MTVFFGRDYVTAINDLVFTPSGGQFGPDATGFDYSEFFGVGEDELVGDTFDVGGPGLLNDLLVRGQKAVDVLDDALRSTRIVVADFEGLAVQR